MIYIANLDSQKFTFNGIPYYKNFMPVSAGDSVKIVNAYDSKLKLCDLTNFADFNVDGTTFDSLANLHLALLPVLYTRASLGGPVTETPFFNKFLIVNGYNLAGNSLTVLSGWQWLINGSLYSNSADVPFEIPFAAEGKTRIDLIVATTTGTFERISGEEVTENPTPPPLPANRLQATFVFVTDGSISEPTTPSSGQYLGFYPSFEVFEATYLSGSSERFDSHGAFAFILFEGQLFIAIFTGETFEFFTLFETQGLQNVMENGGSTNIEIEVYDSDGNFTRHRATGFYSSDTTNGTGFVIGNDGSFMFTNPVGRYLTYNQGAFTLKSSYTGQPGGGGTATFRSDIVEGDLTLQAPKKTGTHTIATVDDIPAYNDRFKGKYTTLANLQSAHPTSNDGDYAIVDLGAGHTAKEYIWDSEDGWVLAGSVSLSTTDALTEGSSNLYFTSARVLATLLAGVSLSTGGTISSGDTILQALVKLQYQITNILTDTVFGAFVNGLTSKTTPIDADFDIIIDTADSNKAKKVTWANRKATMKSYFDTLFSPKKSFMVLPADYTGAGGTGLRAIFNVPTNGEFNALANSTYYFELTAACQFSASSNDWKFGFGGTATISSIKWTSWALKGVTIGTAVSTQISNVATAVQIASSNTQTTGRTVIKGIIRTGTAGTIIPSWAFGISMACLTEAGSSFIIQRLGSNTDNNSNDIT